MMTTIFHISDEELMAFAEGELPPSEAQVVEDHVQECTECAARLAVWREQLERFNETFSAWDVEVVPARVQREVLIHGASRKQKFSVRWPLWTGAAAVLTAVGIIVAVVTPSRKPQEMAKFFESQQDLATLSSEPRASQPVATRARKRESNVAADAMYGYASGEASAPPPPAPSISSFADKAPPVAAAKMVQAPSGGGGALHAPTRIPRAVTAPLGPMIARTASLSILVDNVDKERVALEGLLARYGGYAAQMQVNTPADGTRNLTASLRVPTSALSQAIADLRTLGKVQNESQSGEDVGQDHADLEARLNTARSTEDRLRGILREHTGSVSDVLEVEEEIASTREKIESMEAELDGMEHRVRYATIDLQLNEAAAKPVAHSVSGRLGESIATGWHNAGDLVLGLTLWLAEDGPAIAIVLLLIGVPAWWFWRRYKRSH